MGKQQQLDLICCECGNINTILRSEARNLRIFTKINRYCWACAKQTPQIYIEDKNTAKYQLEMIKTKYAYLRPEQQLALELIEKGKQKIK